MRNEADGIVTECAVLMQIIRRRDSLEAGATM